MTRRLVLLTVSVAAALALAEAPVATVSSSDPFELRGKRVDPSGVPTWPVMYGDSIRATNSAAVLLFRDGSKITLAQGASGVVTKAATAGSVFRVNAGAVQYSLPTSSSVTISNGSATVTGGSGSIAAVSTGSSKGKVNTAISRPLPPPISRR